MDLTIAFVGVAAIVALTGISAFFSSSELAVFSVASHRVDSLVAADVPGARALATLRADSHRFLVTALVSNNVANIAETSVATAVFVRFGFSGARRRRESRGCRWSIPSPTETRTVPGAPPAATESDPATARQFRPSRTPASDLALGSALGGCSPQFSL